MFWRTCSRLWWGVRKEKGGEEERGGGGMVGKWGGGKGWGMHRMVEGGGGGRGEKWRWGGRTIAISETSASRCCVKEEWGGAGVVILGRW